MATSQPNYPYAVPMRIAARQGSIVEQRYFESSALPSGEGPTPQAIAPGMAPDPAQDLIFRGGKIVPQMEFQNIFLGSAGDWPQGDVDSIDRAVGLAMRDKRLNNVIAQYFHGVAVTCDPRPPLVLAEPKPTQLDEPDVQAAVVALYDTGKIKKSDLETTLFNLVLPPGTVLTLGDASSLGGLGGYHGSVHIQRDGQRVTLYYSANVYSQRLPSGEENGIVGFDRPWKNVAAVLYHELNEFRTDADVNDAQTAGSNDVLGWVSPGGLEIGDQPLAAAASLALVLKEVTATGTSKRVPVQFMYSNAVHGAEGPLAKPHPPGQ
jgi:hypothetical protein